MTTTLCLCNSFSSATSQRLPVNCSSIVCLICLLITAADRLVIRLMAVTASASESDSGGQVAGRLAGPLGNYTLLTWPCAGVAPISSSSRRARTLIIIRPLTIHLSHLLLIICVAGNGSGNVRESAPSTPLNFSI